jgi:hypothetical protein
MSRVTGAEALKMERAGDRGSGDDQSKFRTMAELRSSGLCLVDVFGANCFWADLSQIGLLLQSREDELSRQSIQCKVKNKSRRKMEKKEGGSTYIYTTSPIDSVMMKTSFWTLGCGSR